MSFCPSFPLLDEDELAGTHDRSSCEREGAFMRSVNQVRTGAAALLVAAALMLSGCFMMPGKFASQLVVDNTGRFGFTYEGEIFFSTFALVSAIDEKYPELETYCYDGKSLEERACTASEIAKQRDLWEEGQLQKKRDKQRMAVILGGVDPSEPDAPAKLAALLERQAGWEKVEHIRGGLFRVRYVTSGHVDQNFMFPAIEGIPAVAPFVQISARKDGKARITAPAFNPAHIEDLMAAASGEERSSSSVFGSKDLGHSGVATFEGEFAVRTSGGVQIIANNTDEGPLRAEGGELLTWKVAPYRRQTPSALIAFNR